MGIYFQMIRFELLQLSRNSGYKGLILILLILMGMASWNTHHQLITKAEQVRTQLEIVESNDQRLMAEIDSLNHGLATYETSYTLPTSGVRLTYNNHRVAHLPFKPLSIIAIGQGDLYANYKKIILYFNQSYEMSSEELISPIEQLFGQLDLAFVWTYLLPLIIVLLSFNIFSLERESGRLPLIASHPVKVTHWLLTKMSLRFAVIFGLTILFTFILLLIFKVDLAQNWEQFAQLVVFLLLYSAFWFILSFMVNLMGSSSGKSLILLTSIWAFLVFLVPSAINQLGRELNQVPSRLEIVNHHQSVYNEVENNLEGEMENLFRHHPNWRSDDPVTKDLSNPTGWNINYLAKQYLAQMKHQLVAERYENQVDASNEWFSQFRLLSPAMILQEALTEMAGTSAHYYRGFLRQVQEYARQYRLYVFQGLFTNHSFSSEEILHMKQFQFDPDRIPGTYTTNLIGLLIYVTVLIMICLIIIHFTIKQSVKV